MNVWESVKLVQLFSGRLDLIHIVDKHKLNVFGNINKSDNKVVKQCFNITKRSSIFRRLCSDYDFVVDDVLLPYKVYEKFSALCYNYL